MQARDDAETLTTGPTAPAPPSMTPIVGVLDDGERAAIEQRFGVPEAQVVRDHLISHTLAAIASLGSDDIVFFGGTALSRTHLSSLRLSEDIDLVVHGNRAQAGELIEGTITRRLARTFGELTFTPHLALTKGAEPCVMQVGDIRIQIQLLSSTGYPDWPTETMDLEQRYSDAPPARMRVLTAPAFAAAKLSAWVGRVAPRDLYDLWALARAGHLDARAAELFARHGPATDVSKISFDRTPTDEEWRRALGHQCIIEVGPEVAARVVREALDML